MSQSSYGIPGLAALTLALIAGAARADAAGFPQGPRASVQVLSSLLAVELSNALPAIAARSAVRVSANGTVTTATRTLDLDALKATDFGDEPGVSELR